MSWVAQAPHELRTSHITASASQPDKQRAHPHISAASTAATGAPHAAATAATAATRAPISRSHASTDLAHLDPTADAPSGPSVPSTQPLASRHSYPGSFETHQQRQHLTSRHSLEALEASIQGLHQHRSYDLQHHKDTLHTEQQQQLPVYEHVPVPTHTAAPWRSQSPISPLSQLLSELKGAPEEEEQLKDEVAAGHSTLTASASYPPSRSAAREHKPVRRSLLHSLTDARDRDEAPAADQAAASASQAAAPAAATASTRTREPSDGSLSARQHRTQQHSTQHVFQRSNTQPLKRPAGQEIELTSTKHGAASAGLTTSASTQQAAATPPATATEPATGSQAAHAFKQHSTASATTSASAAPSTATPVATTGAAPAAAAPASAAPAPAAATSEVPAAATATTKMDANKPPPLLVTTTFLSAASTSTGKADPDPPAPALVPSAAPEMPPASRQGSGSSAADAVMYQPLRTSLHLLRSQSRRASLGHKGATTPASTEPAAKHRSVLLETAASMPEAEPPAAPLTQGRRYQSHGSRSMDHQPSWRQHLQQQRLQQLEEQEKQEASRRAQEQAQQEEEQMQQQAAAGAAQQQYAQVQQELDTLLEELAHSSEVSPSGSSSPVLPRATLFSHEPDLSEGSDTLSQAGDWDAGYDSDAGLEAIDLEADEDAAELAAEAAYLDSLLQQGSSSAALAAAAAGIARALSKEQQQAQQQDGRASGDRYFHGAAGLKGLVGEHGLEQRQHQHQHQHHSSSSQSCQSWRQQYQATAASSTAQWSNAAAAQREASNPPATSTSAFIRPQRRGYAGAPAAGTSGAASAAQGLAPCASQEEIVARVDVLRAQLSELCRDVMEGQEVDVLLAQHAAAMAASQQQE
jgi:hypothetical protein